MGNKTKKRRKKRQVKKLQGRTTSQIGLCVPTELRQRMNDFQANHYVNWSELFAATIEQYMNDHEDDSD